MSETKAVRDENASHRKHHMRSGTSVRRLLLLMRSRGEEVGRGRG